VEALSWYSPGSGYNNLSLLQDSLNFSLPRWEGAYTPPRFIGVETLRSLPNQRIWQGGKGKK
jgi:hypothetical protein